MSDREPNLRRIRRLLLLLTDSLPPPGPDHAWHPGWRLARALRVKLLPELATLNKFLGD